MTGVADAAAATPCVSVVVPFFNSRRHLAACLRSLESQRDVGGSYEIICVDNGSSDGSADVAAGFASPILLREPRPGAYAARNAGIRRARAPLIAFTDADCVVDGDWLRAIRQGMRDPAAAVLVGPVRYPGEASLPLRALGAWENAKAAYVLERCAPAYRFAWANNMAVRTELFAELGPFREWRRAADSELVHRLAARRPDLEVRFHRAMRVTHLEFLRARDRARRLALYTRTNARIEGFRELGPRRRLAALVHAARTRR